MTSKKRTHKCKRSAKRPYRRSLTNDSCHSFPLPSVSEEYFVRKCLRASEPVCACICTFMRARAFVCACVRACACEYRCVCMCVRLKIDVRLSHHARTMEALCNKHLCIAN